MKGIMIAGKSITMAGMPAAWAQVGSNISIPFDPATDFVYLLLGISLFLIWYGNRRAKKMQIENPEEGGASSEESVEGSS